MAYMAETPGRWALVSLDLEGTADSERQKFNDAIQGKGWRKVDGVTTVWVKQFRHGIAVGQIEHETKEDIGFAALDAGIDSVPAIVQVGEPSPKDVSFLG